MSSKIYGKITVIKRNGANGSQFPVTGSSCTFGRESDCEIRIQLPTVSSHECQLRADENGRFVVSKLNKEGEILVNDKALGAQAVVNHKDVLTIAGRSFRFEYPPQQREKMASGKLPVGTPRPSAVDRLRQLEKRRVSFGPQLSPEQFDLGMPPNTPVKKGAIPMKNLSNTDEINRRRSLLKAAKRKSVGKSASPKSTEGKKEKSVKKRSFDTLVEFVGLDNPKKAESSETENKDKTAKEAASDQLDFFGAIKKTPKTTDGAKSRRSSIAKSSKSGELQQNEVADLNETTPVAKKKPATPTQKRRSVSKCTTPAECAEATDASNMSKTPDQKKRRSKVATPQSLIVVPQHTPEDEVVAEDSEVTSERRRSTKNGSEDLNDTLPPEVDEGKPATPAQKRRSVAKSDTPAAHDAATDGKAATPAQKKRRSKVATPQSLNVGSQNTLEDEVATEDSEVTSERRRSTNKGAEDLNDILPPEVDEGKPATPAQKRRSVAKCDTPAAHDAVTDGEGATPDPKKRRSKVATPQSLNVGSQNTLEDEVVAEDNEVTSERRRSTKNGSDDLNDTLPGEVDEGKLVTPAQKRRSTTKCDTPAAHGAATDGEAATPAQKKCRSRIATPQPSSEVSETSVSENNLEDAAQVGTESITTPNDNSDLIQCDKNEPIAPKQKRKSVSKPTTPARDVEDDKPPKTPKGQTPKTPVRVATASEESSEPESTQESTMATPSQKRRSMSKSVTPKSTKTDDSRHTPSAAVTPKVLEVSTPAGKRKSLSKQQLDSPYDTLTIDDVDQKKIVLIVQEQTPARQPESTPRVQEQTPARQPESISQSPDMVFEIGVETPAAAPLSKKTRRMSRRSKTPQTEFTSADAIQQSETPVVQRKRSIIAGATKSPYRVPSNSAILTARRKSLRRRKSGILLWSDIVRKNANKQVESKPEPPQLQKVTKATRRSIPRTPKQAQNLRHVDSPATIYISRKTRPRRSFAPAPLDMSMDWTSDDGNTTVEDSFVLSQSNVDKAVEIMECDTGCLMKTPKVKGQPVEEHLGTKRLLRTPKEKVKGQPVEEHFGTKRLLKTPKDKVKGQPVEEHFGTKRLLKTPKDKVKGQPVEEHFGTKRLLKTPQEKVKGQPVEEHFGTKRLLQTPKDKVKGQPVEKHFGTKRLLKTPQEKVKGQPVEEHFGTKRLLKTPVDKVKGEPVRNDFGTKRLFGSPKVKGQPVEYNFGTKRLLNVHEVKQKNEPVEDDLCLEQIFGYEADIDENAPDVTESQPLASETPSSLKTSSGKTPKAKSTKSATADAEDMSVVEKPAERVSTRIRESERKQSSDTESDSNEKRSTRRSKVTSVASKEVTQVEIGGSSKKRKQSDDSDSSGSTEKKQVGALTKRHATTLTDIDENAPDVAESQLLASETPSSLKTSLGTTPKAKSTKSATIDAEDMSVVEKPAERVSTRIRKSERKQSSDIESDSNEKKSTRHSKVTSVASKEVTQVEIGGSSKKRKQSDDSDSSGSTEKKQVGALTKRHGTTLTDIDENAPDVAESQLLASETPSSLKTSLGKTPKAKSTKSATTDAEDMSVIEKPAERVSTRTRKSERKQSSDTESDSNEKRSTRRSKFTSVASKDVNQVEITGSSKKRKQSDDSDSSGSTEKKQTGAPTKRRATSWGNIVQENANEANSEATVEASTRRVGRPRLQKTKVDLTEKPKAVSPKTKLTVIPEVEEPSEAPVVCEIMSKVDAEPVAIEKTTISESLSGEEQLKVQEPVVELLQASKRTRTITSKAAEKTSSKPAVKKPENSVTAAKPPRPGAAKSRKIAKTESQPVRSTRNGGKAANDDEPKEIKPLSSGRKAKKPHQLTDDITIELESVSKKTKNEMAKPEVDSETSRKTMKTANANKPVTVRASRRGKVVQDQPRTTAVENETLATNMSPPIKNDNIREPKKTSKKPQSATGKKTTAEDVKSKTAEKAEVTKPARASRRGRVVDDQPEPSKNEPVTKKAKAKNTTESAEVPTKRPTRGTKSKPLKSDSKQKVNQKDGQALVTRKRKTSDDDATKMKKPSKATQNVTDVSEPVRKSTRVRKAK